MKTPSDSKAAGSSRAQTWVLHVRRALLDWYYGNARDLPWRRTRDPYRIWISEIMLQQTRVDTVIPYYERFVERFPDCTSLAEAPLQEVLKLWENLGYYSRARSLHRAAREVVRLHGGRLPRDHCGLVGLPGIGPYTAGAVMSMAFGEPVPAVDGNVRRVLCRAACIDGPPKERAAAERVTALAARLLSPADPGAFNQALMDLGASICLPRKPLCPECPLEEWCEARRQGLEADLPASAKRRPSPAREEVVGLVADQRDSLLMGRRPEGGLLGGLWRFPGGELIPGEGFEDVLRRRLAEVGLPVQDAPCLLGRVSHAYTHFGLKAHIFHCSLQRPGKDLPVQDGWIWVEPGSFGALPVSKLERKILAVFARSGFQGASRWSRWL